PGSIVARPPAPPFPTAYRFHRQFVAKWMPFPRRVSTVRPWRGRDCKTGPAPVSTEVKNLEGFPVRLLFIVLALSVLSGCKRGATQATDQAERQFQRLKTLRESGMTSAQQMEDAEIRRNATQSDLSAAKARVVQARQQLQRTEVRAPFEGIVAERKVSAGDTAPVCKELLKVIDPTSLRLEGLVSSDAIQQVKVGQGVTFGVNG